MRGYNLNSKIEIPLKNTDQGMVDYTESLADLFVNVSDPLTRKKKGQYFTPGKISELMIKQFQNIEKYEKIKVLDPGAGLGIFESAFCEHLRFLGKNVKVSFDIYENDFEIIPYLEQNMRLCKEYMEEEGFEVSYNILKEDFLLAYSHIFHNQNTFSEKNNENYDFIISNPPYYKIKTSSSQVQHMKHIINGQPNIYPFFMALSAKLLKKEGQLTLLTPRSFCSGLYFKNFRKFFFDTVRPFRVHLFESRRKIFSKYSVNQENIILTAIKSPNIPENVQISVSNGIPKLNEDIQIRNTTYDKIIFQRNDDIIMRIPTLELEESIAENIDKFKDNLATIGFKVSTGRVVPFRAKEFLCENAQNCKDSVPLIWMQNVFHGKVNWPLKIGDKFIKIKNCNESRNLLIANSNYVFIKRFSAKDDKQRINAAVFLKNDFDVDLIGIENHVNYIHKKEGQMYKNEAYGIMALLNSEIYNRYFQIENGNTQVNAKEINSFPFPCLDIVRKLGDKVIEIKEFEQASIDKIVMDILNLEDSLEQS